LTAAEQEELAVLREYKLAAAEVHQRAMAAVEEQQQTALAEATAAAAQQAAATAAAEAEASQLRTQLAQVKADLEAAHGAARGAAGRRNTTVDPASPLPGEGYSTGSSEGSPLDRGKAAMDELISSAAELRAELQHTLSELQASAGVAEGGA
jgi:small-conductance mechanosensitive channel